jgi:potassium-dependent mechanosensitive channel
MNNLGDVLIGSASLLTRPSVIVQLVVVWIPILAFMLVRQRLQSYQHIRRAQGASLLCISALIGLLGLMQQPVGLALLCLALTLGSSLCWLTDKLLGCVLPVRTRQRFIKRVVRPTYLLLCALALIDQIASLEQLMRIPLGRLFGTEISIGSAGTAVLVLYILTIGSAPLGRWLAQGLQHLLEFDDGSLQGNALILHYAIFTIGLFALLSWLGLNQNAFLAIAGGLSLGIGFGIREVIANLISGVWLLFEGSVRPGEVLYLDGFPCEVRSLGLRATVLWRDYDNAEIVIPNQSFFTSASVSYSAIQTGTSRLRRSEVVVSADYRHSPGEVVRLLESTALATEGVLPSPEPKGYVLDYGESGVSYGVRFFIAHPMHNIAITSSVRMRIWEAFSEREIRIPFPQRVLHEAN